MESMIKLKSLSLSLCTNVCAFMEGGRLFRVILGIDNVIQGWENGKCTQDWKMALVFFGRYLLLTDWALSSMLRGLLPQFLPIWYPLWNDSCRS